jgi:hypothetical protein
MSKFDEYQKYKNEHEQAKSWLSLIGKEQTRTTPQGVKGAISKFVSEIEINFQASDGAQNYHKPPTAFQHALNEVLMEQRHTLLGKAFEKMQDKQGKLAQEAKDEYEALMRESGLV